MTRDEIVTELSDLLSNLDAKNRAESNQNVDVAQLEYAEAMADWFISSTSKATITIPAGTAISTSVGPGIIVNPVICNIEFL